MPRAQKYSDYAHARIYQSWFSLPAWKRLRPTAQLLLVHMLAEFRPGWHEILEWTLTRVQTTLNCSRVTASDCMTELEKNGWMEVVRVGRFEGGRKPSLYRPTMHKSLIDGTPASHAYLHIQGPPRVARNKNPTGSNKTDTGSLLEPPRVPIETASAPEMATEPKPENTPKPQKTEATAQQMKPVKNTNGSQRSQLLYGTAPRVPVNFGRWSPQSASNTPQLPKPLHPLSRSRLPDQRH